jgi:hypothetical protein
VFLNSCLLCSKVAGLNAFAAAVSKNSTVNLALLLALLLKKAIYSTAPEIFNILAAVSNLQLLQLYYSCYISIESAPSKKSAAFFKAF